MPAKRVFDPNEFSGRDMALAVIMARIIKEICGDSSSKLDQWIEGIQYLTITINSEYSEYPHDKANDGIEEIKKLIVDNLKMES